MIFVTKQDEKCNEKSMKISEKSEDRGEKGGSLKNRKIDAVTQTSSVTWGLAKN